MEDLEDEFRIVDVPVVGIKLYGVLDSLPDLLPHLVLVSLFPAMLFLGRVIEVLDLLADILNACFFEDGGEFLPGDHPFSGKVMLLKYFVHVLLSDLVICSKVVPSENDIIRGDELFVDVILLELVEDRFEHLFPLCVVRELVDIQSSAYEFCDCNGAVVHVVHLLNYHLYLVWRGLYSYLVVSVIQLCLSDLCCVVDVDSMEDLFQLLNFFNVVLLF